MVKSGSAGRYLTDGSGRTLYLFAKDSGGKSTCFGACAQYWPPFVASSQASATDPAVQRLLGTTDRGSGTKQVTYQGHPLYYFAGDSKPGDTKGQGVNGSGGLWWMVAPNGSAITAKAGSHSSGAKGGGGYGY